MTYWKCPYCFREHESNDNVKIVFCSECLFEMKQFPYPKKRIEVENEKRNTS